MSIEDFSTKYAHDGAEDRKVFNISDPEYREAVRLIQVWIGNGMLSHIFFDPMALAGVLRQAYDQGRLDERAALKRAPDLEGLKAELAHWEAPPERAPK